MADFSSSLGITIDTALNYNDEAQKVIFRDLLWNGEKIHPDLKQAIEEACQTTMRQILVVEMPELTEFELLSDVYLHSDDEDCTFVDRGFTTLDVLFDEDHFDELYDLVPEDDFVNVVIAAIQAVFVNYIEGKGGSVQGVDIEHSLGEWGGS